MSNRLAVTTKLAKANEALESFKELLTEALVATEDYGRIIVDEDPSKTDDQRELHRRIQRMRTEVYEGSLDRQIERVVRLSAEVFVSERHDV